MSKSDTMAVVLRQQEILTDECPRCDVCGKARFIVKINRITANHKAIATTAVYGLCKGPDTCTYHCTCHLDIPKNFGVTHVLHVV